MNDKFKLNISIPAEVEQLMDLLLSAGYKAYIVGGCIRDILMGYFPHDWDACTDARPADMLRVFSGYCIVETGIKHGTITVLNGMPIEITTFREDGDYSDNRHPDSINFVNNIEEDLSRRDFTINAMACDRDGQIIDPHGGYLDLNNKIIRCVGDPDTRFCEDALRILRALRFASRLNFAIETGTSEAMRRNSGLLKNIAPERIFAELKGIIMGDGAGKLMMDYGDIFAEILPELSPMQGFDQRNPHHVYDVWEHSAHALDAGPQDEVARLALLMHDSGKPKAFTVDAGGRGHFYGHPAISARIADGILRRLRSDNSTREKVIKLITLHDSPPPDCISKARRLLTELDVDAANLLMDVQYADGCAQADEYKPAKFAKINLGRRLIAEASKNEPCFRIADLEINGYDLMELGVQSGPRVGQLLRKLFDEVIDGATSNVREALLKRARELIEAD